VIEKPPQGPGLYFDLLQDVRKGCAVMEETTALFQSISPTIQA